MPRKPRELYASPAWRAVRRRVLERDGHRCQLRCSPKCRGAADSVDHAVRPEDGGAPFDESNLRAACVPCNSAKRNTQLAERARMNRAVAKVRDW